MDLLDFLVRLMGSTPPAVLLQFQAVRHVLLVFGGNVVFPFAHRTLKSNVFLHTVPQTDKLTN